MKISTITAAVLLTATSMFASGNVSSSMQDETIVLVFEQAPGEKYEAPVSDNIFDLDNGTLSGGVEAQYRYVDKDNNNNLFTTTGNLKYVTGGDALLQAGVNFYDIESFGVFDEQDRMQRFLKPDGSGYAIMNEAYLKGNYNLGGANVYAKAGRFQLGERLINSQNASMYDFPVPNSFEGGIVGLNMDNGFSFKGAWISRMSGDSNGIDPSRFVRVEEAASTYYGGNGDGTDGLYFAKAGYNYDNRVFLNLENVYLNNYSNTFLEEVTGDVSSFVGLSNPLFVSQQYLNYNSENDSVESDVWGLEAAMAVTDNIVGTIAYNNVSDTGIPGFAFGADPLYTSMQAANAYGIGSSDSVKVSGKYLFENGNVEAAYGYFDGDNGMETNAVEVTGEYNVNKNVKVKGVATYTDDSIDDTVGFRALVAYQF